MPIQNYGENIKKSPQAICSANRTWFSQWYSHSMMFALLIVFLSLVLCLSLSIKAFSFKKTLVGICHHFQVKGVMNKCVELPNTG